MYRLVATLCFALICSGFLKMTGSAIAADNPNILIMAEDFDLESIPRNSRISTRIVNAMMTQMDHHRFKVYDETAVSLDTHKQGRNRRTDAELIDIAKSLKNPPIDIVVFFSVYSNVMRKASSNDLNLRIIGRLLSVQEGRRLGNWEEEVPDRWSLPNRCFTNNKVSRPCLLETVGSSARKIGAGVSSMLAERLAHLIDGQQNTSTPRNSQLAKGYRLSFEGFNNDDIREIEEFLAIFSGYEDHRPTAAMTKYVEFWYESTIKILKLRRNLEKMMEHMGLDYVIHFSGNKFSMRNKNLRMRGIRIKPSGSYNW